MRILFVSTAAHSPHVLRPLRYLLDRGHEVAVLGRVNPFPEGHTRFSHIWHDLTHDHIMGTLAEIGRVFAPEVAHVHYADLAAYHVLRSGIAPVVLSVWGSDINAFVPAPGGSAFLRKFKSFVRWDLPYTLPRCARVLVDAQAMSEKCRFVAPDCAPIEHLHLGADMRQFRPPTARERADARARFGIAGEHVALLSPRAFYSSYQHEAILASFLRVGKKHPDAHLYFKRFGLETLPEHQAFAERLCERARRSPLADRVHFLPAVEEKDLHQLYWAMDGIINIPRNDAFPVTFVEAAATKTPIVTRLLPAYKNTFIERTASLVEPFSDDALDTALDAFFTRPEADERRLDRALDAARTEYSFEKYCARLEEIYTEIARPTAKVPPVLRKLPDGPLISLLTSAYNAAEYLPDLLRSLQQQVYPNWEIIVVDDASTRGDVAAIVASFNDARIRTVRHAANRGACAGRNTAFAHSSGQYVMYQDADDVLHPWLLQLLATAALERPEADIVMYDLACFGAKNTCWHYTVRTEKDMTLEQWIPGTAMVRRSLYERVGGYDESPRLKAGNQDWDFWLAAFGEAVTVAHIPLPLMYYRRHGNSLTAKRARFDVDLHAYLYETHKDLFMRHGTGRQFLARGVWNTGGACLRGKEYRKLWTLMRAAAGQGLLPSLLRLAGTGARRRARRATFQLLKTLLGPARPYARSLQRYVQLGLWKK